MNTALIFRKRGWITPLWLNQLVLFVLIVGLYAGLYYLFFFKNTESFIRSVCAFAVAMVILEVLDSLSSTRIDTATAQLRVRSLAHLLPLNTNVLEVKRVQISNRKCVLNNVRLITNGGKQYKLSIANTDDFIRALQQLNPTIVVE